MKNQKIESWKSKVKVYVKGKNVPRYILRLSKNHIPLLKIKKIKKEEYFIWVYYADYEKIEKLNTIYELKIVGYGGWIEKKKTLSKVKILIGAIGLAVIVLFVLSRMIFRVEVVTNDSIMRKKLLTELQEYGITSFHFQKNYQELMNIKENLLNRHHEDIEWLEIESIGTKYIVRFEPRITNSEQEKAGYRHIVASKNAIIKKIESSKGQVLKNQNEYVKKGDIIVSGYIAMNGAVKDTVSAEGTIFGETWYEVEIFYPLGYYEQKKTGKKKDVYVLEFLSHRFELFNFHPFYDKISSSDTILGKQEIPIYFKVEHQEEVVTISSIQTEEMASVTALELATSKIEETLDGEEKILQYKILSQKLENNGVYMRVFFSVYEDITEYESITPYVEDKDEGDNT